MRRVNPTCPNCGGEKLYRTEPISSGGEGGPFLLPSLGSFLHYAEFVPVVRADCGLTRFFADMEAVGKLATSDRWRKL